MFVWYKTKTIYYFNETNQNIFFKVSTALKIKHLKNEY